MPAGERWDTLSFGAGLEAAHRAAAGSSCALGYVEAAWAPRGPQAGGWGGVVKQGGAAPSPSRSAPWCWGPAAARIRQRQLRRHGGRTRERQSRRGAAFGPATGRDRRNPTQPNAATTRPSANAGPPRGRVIGAGRRFGPQVAWPASVSKSGKSEEEKASSSHVSLTAPRRGPGCVRRSLRRSHRLPGPGFEPQVGSLCDWIDTSCFAASAPSPRSSSGVHVGRKRGVTTAVTSGGAPGGGQRR